MFTKVTPVHLQSERYDETEKKAHDQEDESAPASLDGQIEVGCRKLSGADVEGERLPDSGHKEVDELGREAETEDPRAEEQDPEAVVHRGWVLEPENEGVANDHHGVDGEHEHVDDHVLQEILQIAIQCRKWVGHGDDDVTGQDDVQVDDHDATEVCGELGPIKDYYNFSKKLDRFFFTEIIFYLKTIQLFRTISQMKGQHLVDQGSSVVMSRSLIPNDEVVKGCEYEDSGCDHCVGSNLGCVILHENVKVVIRVDL